MGEQEKPPAGMLSDWGLALRPLVCERCDWAYLVPVGAPPARCPHCWQGPLTPVEQADGLPHLAPPELVLPFTVSEEVLALRVTDFARGIPFAPRDLNPAALKARLQRLYLPLWLVDGTVAATWEASTGFNYQVVSHQERYSDSQGAWATQELQETRLRWEPRVGQLKRTYQNIMAPALEEEAKLRGQLGSYNQGVTQPYRPEAMTQAVIRLPNRTPDDAWSAAVPAFQAEAMEECRRAAGADQIREFRWAPTYTALHWTLLLQPVYATYYLDDESVPRPVLIHGQSGQLSGARRASWQRAQRLTFILCLVAVILGGLSLLAAAAGFIAPPLLPLAGVGLIVATLVGVGALVPLLVVWRFNRRVPLIPGESSVVAG